MMPNSMIWSSLEISSLSSFVTSACEMGTLSSTPKPPLALNSLYINPCQFTFQLPLWQEMRKEGLPINSFCVAAGISTTESCRDYRRFEGCWNSTSSIQTCRRYSSSRQHRCGHSRFPYHLAVDLRLCWWTSFP